MKFGFIKAAAFSLPVNIADPESNTKVILKTIESSQDKDLMVFPELSISGYSCGDLFRQQCLLSEVEKNIIKLRNESRDFHGMIFVGAPVCVQDKLYNCAVAIHAGKICGITPKQYIPNYNEFYEARHFARPTGKEQKNIWYGSNTVPFGTGLMYKLGCQDGTALIFPEICEDLWVPIPPSSYAALAGANIIVNLSASNETVGKSNYRLGLVENQSARCIAGYVYSSAGPEESTSDVVFGGHCMIAENGILLDESKRIGENSNFSHAEADIDIQKLSTERRINTSFASIPQEKEFTTIYLFNNFNKPRSFKRFVDGQPFVPKSPSVLKEHCSTIFNIQCAGLKKRLTNIGCPDVYIGISGGLDSTLAALVAAKVARDLHGDAIKVHGITMPGFGTSTKTLTNAKLLMGELGISMEEIDICELCRLTFKTLNHHPFGIDPDCSDFYSKLMKVPKEKRHDLVFENVQARERTKILMSKGFVIGTGDMSELALGWCTYNGDHMSMYNVNASIPKTLVASMVRHIAENDCKSTLLKSILLKIADTPISPELLPRDEKGESDQSTESILGPYELHDFFLFHFVRNGFSPRKILFLAGKAAFHNPLSNDPKMQKTALKEFIRRFFMNQFKRNCVPDGPKVGSVALSPRGDWRMPSDAVTMAWLKDLEDDI